MLDIINQESLNRHGLSIQEFLYLILFFYIDAQTTDISSLETSLINKGYLIRFQNLDGTWGYKIGMKGNNAIKTINADSQNPNKEGNLEELALQLKELFPKGSKSPGHPWRSNTTEIISKLKRFIKTYEYSHEEILAATKHYVNSMQNDTTYMRTLKHFIIKSLPSGEIVSDLASYIENADPDELQSWTLELRGA